MPAPLQKLRHSFKTHIHHRPPNRNANDKISSSIAKSMTYPHDEVGKANLPQTHEPVHPVDREFSKKESQTAPYWNSVMTEGARRPEQSYAKVLAYRPYQRTSENPDPLPSAGEDDGELEDTFDEVKNTLDDLGYRSFLRGLHRGGHGQNRSHITQIDFAPNPHRTSSTFAILSKQGSTTPTIRGRSTSDIGISRPPTPYPGAPATAPSITTKREQDEKLPNGEVSVATPSPWELDVQKLMSSGRLNPAQLEALQQTLQETPALDLCRRGDTLSTIAQGLVPNFSRPLPTSLHPRRSSSVYSSTSDTPRDDHEHHIISDAPTNGVPKDYFNHRTPSPDHSKPSGLPPTSELHLLRPTPPSSPVDDKTLIARHEGTIATQAFIIKQLHRIIDSQRKRGEYLEDTIIPDFSEALEDSERMVALLTGTAQIMEQEIGELKVVCETGNRLLGACWARQWHLWGWLNALSHKKSSKPMSILRGICGGRDDRQQNRDQLGPEWYADQHPQTLPNGISRTDTRASKSSTSASGLSRRELDAVTETAYYNLEITREDVNNVSRLVKGWEDRKVIAIQEMFGEANPEPGSWRDV